MKLSSPLRLLFSRPPFLHVQIFRLLLGLDQQLQSFAVLHVLQRVDGVGYTIEKSGVAFKKRDFTSS